MVTRREFVKWLISLFSLIIAGCISRQKQVEEVIMKEKIRSKVYVIKTGDRALGVGELLKRIDPDLQGKRVALKANYNSADAFPASTHPDTLSAVIIALKERGAGVILAERSGMGVTQDVLRKMGVLELAKEHGFEVVVLDDLGSEGWIKEEGSHWKRGYLFPKLFKEADAVVQTCCLKTHRYGGHFTLSLKNSVGMAAKYDPSDGYNYMSELHTSPHQRTMIAEINASYVPEFVIMDGIMGFSKGGPESGTLIEPGVMIAGRDRVAIDAVGVAILRIHGTTGEVSRGKIFEQEQIARAIELGLGASGGEEIEVIAVNGEAGSLCAAIEEKLDAV